MPEVGQRGRSRIPARPLCSKNGQYSSKFRPACEGPRQHRSSSSIGTACPFRRRRVHSRKPCVCDPYTSAKWTHCPPPTSQPTARPEKNDSSAPVLVLCRGRVRPCPLLWVEILRRNKTCLEHQAPAHTGNLNDSGGSLAALAPRPGEVFLLCSDGLVDELDDDAVAAVLREDATPATACRRLLHAALEKGGRDNISVIVIKHVEGDVEPEYELRPEDTQPRAFYRPSCTTE